MIHVDPIEPDGQKWKDWRADADAETRRLLKARSIEINEDLYKTCRDIILERFHGKCAYCESSVTADQHKGDVEHFRPKKRVTDEAGKLVYLKPKKPHPGYFWLAYDWRNLFPACRACNQPGEGAGKWDRFPVLGKRAMKPADPLTSEEPLLIDPYNDDPADHLVFDPDTGMVGHKTKKGEMTIKILGLNRDGLVEMRKMIAEAARNEYSAFARAITDRNPAEKERRKKEWQRYEDGSAVYSAIGREAIRILREELRNQL